MTQKTIRPEEGAERASQMAAQVIEEASSSGNEQEPPKVDPVPDGTVDLPGGLHTIH